jgi:hypothetical protein
MLLDATSIVLAVVAALMLAANAFEIGRTIAPRQLAIETFIVRIILCAAVYLLVCNEWKQLHGENHCGV